MTALEALNLAAPIADAYTSVEERLLLRIARQLTLNDDHQLNEVSKWQIKQLAPEARAAHNNTQQRPKGRYFYARKENP